MPDNVRQEMTIVIVFFIRKNWITKQSRQNWNLQIKFNRWCCVGQPKVAYFEKKSKIKVFYTFVGIGLIFVTFIRR